MMLKSALVPTLSSSISTICKMRMIHFCFSFSKYADISTYAGFQWKKDLFYKFVRVLFLIFTNYFFLRRILKVLCNVAVFSLLVPVLVLQCSSLWGRLRHILSKETLLCQMRKKNTSLPNRTDQNIFPNKHFSNEMQCSEYPLLNFSI